VIVKVRPTAERRRQKGAAQVRMGGRLESNRTNLAHCPLLHPSQSLSTSPETSPPVNGKSAHILPLATLSAVSPSFRACRAKSSAVGSRMTLLVRPSTSSIRRPPILTTHTVKSECGVDRSTVGLLSHGSCRAAQRNLGEACRLFLRALTQRQLPLAAQWGPASCKSVTAVAMALCSAFRSRKATFVVMYTTLIRFVTN
jgi:hypothetical protein